MSKVVAEYQIELASLLAGIAVVDPIWDRQITGLSIDSRTVQAGDLFIAYPGLTVDGRDFIDDAIANGAVAVLAEQNGVLAARQHIHQVPILCGEDILQQISKIAARFYGHPSRHMQLIGVTGTNGKTTCSQLIAKALNDEQPCAVIGTIGYGLPNQLQSLSHTTPDAIKLQKILAAFHRESITRVAMEVSSHALAQGRVKNVEYDIAVFTNLSHEHLDYHGDMDAYGEAKSQLFQQFGLRYAVLNIDDHLGQMIFQNLPPMVQPLTYSVHNIEADIFAGDIRLHHHGISAALKTPWGDGILHSPLLGRFNVSNLLVVVACLGILGVPLEEILSKIKSLQAIPGRMQTFEQAQRPKVIIDYAHSPDALEKALTAIREHNNAGKIWCVFGCGGGRDNEKRALMGHIAEEYAEQVIVTNDNPRHEDPQKIIQQILSGVANRNKVHVEPDRRKAITLALTKAATNDVVLIAGKGHEDYQIIGHEVHDFLDARVVEEVFASQ